MEAWAIESGVQLAFIRPGRPVENSFIESFNGRLRDECLNVEWFASLDNAKTKLAAWRHHYNHERPHSALEDVSGRKRFALPVSSKSNGEPPQGFAAPAAAALDPARRLTENDNDQGEALLRIARSRGSLLGLWSDLQARKPGSGVP
jgi:transposase InsO family protein